MNHELLVFPSRVFGVPVTWQLELAAALTLAPLLIAGFTQRLLVALVERLPHALRLFGPALLCIPYVLVTEPLGRLRIEWLAVYAGVPVAITWLMLKAQEADRSRRGNWRDFLILAVLGLAVDLRWFERAWPPRFGIFNKMLLLDVGLYGFLLIRKLDGVGFTFLLGRKDVRTGLREFAWYTPIALVLGLALGFLHFHALLPHPSTIALAYVFTFFFIATPEELFFRGWLQNLLERRMSRTAALILTSIVFGLSHFNKRAVHFNWQYVLLASIAGFFYGRAWQQDRRIGASAITHACVDTVWSQWLR